MKIKINVASVLLFSALLVTAISFIEFSGSFEWKEVASLDIQKKDRMQELNQRFGVVRITSLQNGRVIGYKTGGTMMAKAFDLVAQGPESGSEILLQDDANNTYLLKSDQAGIGAEMTQAYAKLPFVTIAEENQQGVLFAAGEAEKKSIYSMNNTSVPKVDRADKILIALIDSGIDLQHQALGDSVFINKSEKSGKNNVDDDNNGFKDDVHGWNFVANNNNVADTIGHGTHIAGIISAHKQKGSRMEGVNPEGTSLLVLKVADQSKPMKLSNVVSALLYANEQQIDAVNMSLGFEKESELLHSVIKKLDQSGVFLVAAAGNSENESKVYPAAYPEVFAVGSNRPGLAVEDDISADKWIDARFSGRLLSTLPGQQYGLKKGSSQSAAFATGLFSLLKQQNSNSTKRQLEAGIINFLKNDSTADSLQPLQDDNWTSRIIEGIESEKKLSLNSANSWNLDEPITKAEMKQLLIEIIDAENRAIALIDETLLDSIHPTYSPSEMIENSNTQQTDQDLIERKSVLVFLMRLHSRLFSEKDFPARTILKEKKSPFMLRSEFVEYLRHISR